LIELLVVIAIIGILSAILLVAISDAKPRAQRIKCLSNIKQVGLGMLAYGMDNRDRLPVMQGGNWAWDLPVVAADTLLRSGLTQDVMYDPGFAEMSSLWTFAVNATVNPYRVIGYALTLPGTASLIKTNENRLIVTELVTIGPVVLPAPDPSRRVLVAGATISRPGENNIVNRLQNHYTGVMGGAPFPHRSAHMEPSGNLPLGDNEAMLDGSGKWVRFAAMIPRTQGNSPVFWW
jgi:Tfp pilus assembly protein FimT